MASSCLGQHGPPPASPSCPWGHLAGEQRFGVSFAARDSTLSHFPSLIQLGGSLRARNHQHGTAYVKGSQLKAEAGRSRRYHPMQIQPTWSPRPPSPRARTPPTGLQCHETSGPGRVKLFGESPQNSKCVIPVTNTPHGDLLGMGELGRTCVK